ncbi:MAG: type 4a pilus biogenesis protein PilO [Nitrospirae bacterium]|nr:type 4a pilus biogenesis protein PilO [Nitrospirota bacterium]MBF0533730.1 type 4a pilus biogenesis protein PilO [Nitrospirota bacterium]MBF0615561.1 type 4a pilus biogenesis protein PilO [Nitrospirota bacterium]
MSQNIKQTGAGISKDRIRKIGFLLVALLTIARFGIVPLTTEVEKKKSVIEDYKVTYASKMELLKRYMSIDMNDYPEVNQELSQLVFPKESNKTSVQTDIVKFLTTTAEGRQLNVSNFQMVEGSEGSVITEVTVIIKLKGKPKKIIEFLREVQNHKPLVRIKNIELNQSGDTDYAAKIVASAYIRKL